MKPLVLKLNPHSRWFEVTDEIPAVESTCLNSVVSVVSSKKKTGEIVDALRGKCSRRAVEQALHVAVKRKLLAKPQHGVYEPQKPHALIASAEKVESFNTEQPALNVSNTR